MQPEGSLSEVEVTRRKIIRLYSNIDIEDGNDI